MARGCCYCSASMPCQMAERAEAAIRAAPSWIIRPLVACEAVHLILARAGLQAAPYHRLHRCYSPVVHRCFCRLLLLLLRRFVTPHRMLYLSPSGGSVSCGVGPGMLLLNIGSACVKLWPIVGCQAPPWLFIFPSIQLSHIWKTSE